MKVVIIVVFLITIVVANELNSNPESKTDLARKKNRGRFPFHFLGYGFGIHALAILYWIKVKVVIVSFIIGTAIVWGFRYFSHHFKSKSCPEIIHEGPVIPYDHGPIWHGHDHHDHISYSAPHDFISDHDPYGGYHYSDSDIVDVTSHPHRRRTARGREMSTEEQVGEMIFTFLGVGTDACRKRFLCEMEFRANDNKLTSMAFRVIGRGIFFKYVRDASDSNTPKSFADCGRVHSECEFIEEHISADETNDRVGDEDEAEESSTIVEHPETTSVSNEHQPHVRRIKTVAEAILRRPSQ